MPTAIKKVDKANKASFLHKPSGKFNTLKKYDKRKNYFLKFGLRFSKKAPMPSLASSFNKFSTITFEVKS